MKLILCQLFLFLALPVAFAQEPVLTWGPAIEKDPRTLQSMHVVGSTDGRSYYAVYVEEGQATLERYNEHNQRVWATALLPRTPASQSTTFYDVVLLQDKLYLLSTFRAKGSTTVYAQEISPNGNYGSTVQALVSAQGIGIPHIAVSEDKTLLLATLSESTNNSITSKVLNTSLQPRWSQSLKVQGTVQQTLLLNNGAAFILTGAPANTRNPFLLHRLDAQNGKPEQLTFTNPEQFSPTQAEMAVTSAQSLVVAGYYASVAEASEQNPEPKGTFYLHFGQGTDLKNKTVSTYTPFNPEFLKDYKRYKSDADKIQRLRNLQLHKVLPLASGGVIITGEVAFIDNINGTRTFHNDDIVVVRMTSAGEAVYMTSANKLQSAAGDNEMLSSYLATTVGDNLYLLYIDFEYNYTAENTIVMAGPGSINKGPVLITIPPGGRPLQVMPLHQSQTGRGAGLYLRPTSAYNINDQEIIVLGIGKNFYKYGRLKLE